MPTPHASDVELLVDGGAEIGFGHAGRCLALAEELGDQAFFRIADPAVAEFVTATGARVSEESSEPGTVMVVDRHEPTGEAEVRRLQAAGHRVALLDDLGDGRAAADLVIDPPTAASWPPAGGRRLGGFEHVLLRRAIVDAVRESAPAEHVLIAMGGSDPAGLTPALSDAVGDRAVETVSALGPGYRGPRPRGRIVATGEFAKDLASSRLAVIAYGHTLLEAAHAGVPAVAIIHRPEHLEHARAFCGNGTALLADMTSGPRPADAASLVGSLLADEARRAEMASRGRAAVDGRGAARVAQALRDLL